MKWVTRSHVHVDRVACPWLIKRFVDNEAEFIFAPASQVMAIAGETGAIPFDCRGEAEIDHHEGRCSFETIIFKYELKDKALLRMAQIVHSADVAQDIMVEPVAAGLDFLCRGVRLISPDDQTALERGRMLYDALYAQLAMENQGAE